jgi:hypothetical protein
MTSGERRLAERLESKLDSDYWLWYDVPMGPRNTHPDFCVMHPRRGILVLEVKDWRVGSTILQADKQNWEIMGDSGPKTVINPLERDVQLVKHEGAHAGKLAFPWTYGVLLTRRCKSFREGDAGMRTHIPFSCWYGSEAARTSVAIALTCNQLLTKNR